VVDAADFLADHPAGVQQGAAVRAASAHQVQGAALAAVQGQFLAHDQERNGGAGGDALGQRDRLPELTQQAAHWLAAAGFGEFPELLGALFATLVLDGVHVGLRRFS